MTLEEIVKIEGLQFMPIQKNKMPLFKEWQISKKEYDFTGHDSIGLVCGKISGNVEAIDIDIKYDLTGGLWKEYCALVSSLQPDLLKKLVIQKTPSRGYHLIYKCSFIEGNQKLANRYTVQEEKQNTYIKTYEHELSKLSAEDSISEDKKIELAKEKANKSASTDTIRVLFETRGEKGFIACCPTAGYKLLYGTLDKIQVITPQERSTLFNAAYAFNEVLKEPVYRPVKQKKQTIGLTAIEDYNQRADVVALLEAHGWTTVTRKGSKILMKRPGDTKADHSGNFDEDKNWFSVFTTSTQFLSETPYLPYAVFTMLECDGDFSLTPKKLSDLGYGDSQETIKENNQIIPSIIDLTDEDDLSFLAKNVDFEEYLKQWRSNSFVKGKSTGIPELDKFFLFKESNLVIVNGIDNVGKSTIIWYLNMLSALYNDWDWLIFSSENAIGSIIRKLIEFYWCEPIVTMSDLKYQKAKAYVLSKFDFIKCSDRLYNYQDIINMSKLALKKKNYKGLMIDPYNSLKVDIGSKSKLSVYDYHYEAASNLQLFGKQNNLSIYLNCHCGTSAARKKDSDGFTMAPEKEDTEMGVMFANKADDFLTIHRITQHDKNWDLTEIHVRKIKETETGGRVTPKTKPVKIRMVDGVVGFTHFDHNAVKQWHTNNQVNIQPKIVFSEPIKEQLTIENYDVTKQVETEVSDLPF